MYLFCRNVVVLLYLAAAAFAQEEQQAGTCETDNGMTCRSANADDPTASSTVCGVSSELCSVSEYYSLYSHGGSAQAYVPNAPVKDEVCHDINTGMKHKVATWPLSRSNRGKPAPKLTVTANLWRCSSSSSEQEECCCESLSDTEAAKVEVWQARPDGTYSSLQSGNGDCRATVMPNDGQVKFNTMVPGSTGALGGLGPSGWDVAPYGQPVIHMLVTTPNHQPLLIHVPIVPRAKTLEQRNFWGGDWRGHAGKKKTKADAFNVTSWTVEGDAEIQVELDVFLARGSSSQNLKRELCPSRLYGMPNSFFLEPIAVCAPSLLNFFPL